MANEIEQNEESLPIDELIDEGFEQMTTLEPGSESYKKTAEALAKLSTARIDDFRAAMEQQDKEERRAMEMKFHEDEMKLQREKLELEREERDARLEMEFKAHEDELALHNKQERREWVKIGLTVAGFIVSEAIFLILDNKCLHLEEFGTLNTKIGGELRKEIRKPSIKF